MGWVQESHVKEPLGFPTKIPTICRDSLVVSNNGLCTTLKMHHRSMRLMDNQFRLVHKFGRRKIRKGLNNKKTVLNKSKDGRLIYNPFEINKLGYC